MSFKMKLKLKPTVLLSSAVDALDYTEKWLKDTVTWLRGARAEGSGGASAAPPSHLPNIVHNQAYLRLLLWDHVSDPFPEVNPSDPVTSCVAFLYFYSCPAPHRRS